MRGEINRRTKLSLNLGFTCMLDKLVIVKKKKKPYVVYEKKFSFHFLLLRFPFSFYGTSYMS